MKPMNPMRTREPRDIVEAHCRGCSSRSRCLQTRRDKRVTDKRLVEIIHGMSFQESPEDEPDPKDDLKADDADNIETNKADTKTEVTKEECEVIRKLAGIKPEDEEGKEDEEDKEPPKPPAPPEDAADNDDEADIADFEDEFT